jgi:hypothetical protein
LALLLESSDDIGKMNFEKMKEFAKEFVSAFDMSDSGSRTRVAVVTYGKSATVHVEMNNTRMSNPKIVKNEIDKIQFQPGAGSGVHAGLQKVLDNFYAAGVDDKTLDHNNKVCIILVCM